MALQIGSDTIENLINGLVISTEKSIELMTKLDQYKKTLSKVMETTENKENYTYAEEES